MQRLITAAVLGGLFWFVLKKLSPGWFVAMAAIAIGVGAWELYRMLQARGSRPFLALGTIACIAIPIAFSGFVPWLDPVQPLIAVAVVATLAAMARRANPEEMFDATSSTIFPVLIVGLPLGYAAALRVIPGEIGPDLVLLMMVCVTFGDAAAYYTGRAFGKHRMAPMISPKKSWEGAAGAFGGSFIGALVAHFWFFQRLTLGHAAAVSVVVCIAGMLGDLAESMMKRATGVKDSSAILPGHGGILDRLDALLFSAPVLYYYWRVVLEGSI